MRTLLSVGVPDGATADSVRSLARDATEADGVAPLSEQPLLRLTDETADLTHVVALDEDQRVVGYLQVDRSGDPASAELVVAPSARRHGVGRLLLRTAERDATLPARSGEPRGSAHSLRVWAHGDLRAARALAKDAGLVPVRELLKLGRDLAGHSSVPAQVSPPAGHAVRPFVPGADDAAWLALNALAFADHPEQGRLTLADLHARASEDWFDPAGFFLLEDVSGTDARLVGFVWTKIPTGQDDAVREGEIYVVGVDPGAQGHGLGGYLTAIGTAHLEAAGCARAALYVDGDNTAAVRAYARAGYGRDAVDVQYARPQAPPPPPLSSLDSPSVPSDATMSP
ncbi:mycothiol acetyltransferase [Paraoerskovia sediminicola]|uniref:Mycothiol acetyltransferase n=1 Tax=Paraoerskovia sediminicola TaxID=1138587 RepID=A0ABM8G0G5_9CELL|nr:mycothiol synthase [Paraoerskovia sediminicola]BDZ41518.1 mycothiol acetyltransferase [Paraoerskovia sediminicola]